MVTLLVSFCGFGYLFYLWWEAQQPGFVRYPEFGIPIPSRFSIHGIDVSRYQERISWEEVSAMQVDGIRIHFAFIKATEGIRNVDPYFKRNWRKSREAGVIRGAYHYFIASKDGEAQAKQFIKTVSLMEGDLPPVIDVEDTFGKSRAELRKEVSEWLRVVERHYGIRPIIYTGADFYKQNLQGHFDEYPLWVAHYLQPNQPRISREWSFWQHSESGRVNGIASRVDFNVFQGDSIRFRSLLVP